MSGGEKARLLLAKLFLNEHNFLILDEPTNDLDFETLNLLKENVKNYDGTVLIISHDRFFLDHTIDKLIVFENNGKISGKLNCSNADISGNISGNIEVNETLSLMSGSYVQGEIITGKLSVEEGAQVDATIVMKTGKQLKAVEKQTKAVKLHQENYKAFSELGYALEKKGEPRKAIGAYNFSLRINPRYYLAWRYRGEALIQLGLIKDAKESHMVLFKNDQELAAQLMTSFDEWLAQIETTGSLEEEEFIEWLSRRKSLAKIAFGLTNRSKDSP